MSDKPSNIIGKTVRSINNNGTLKLYYHKRYYTYNGRYDDRHYDIYYAHKPHTYTSSRVEIGSIRATHNIRYQPAYH